MGRPEVERSLCTYVPIQAENITYHIDYEGSMESYRYLLGRIHEKNYIIHLYNGNWDVVIPYHDTIENIKRLNLVESYI
jgi:hypothetical protein